jgi:hypothetical protein
MVAINPRSSSAAGPSKPQQSKLQPYKIFGSRLLKALLITVSFLVYLVFIPPFLVIVAPLYIYRLCVILLAKLCKPSLVKIVGPRDAVVGLDDVTEKCLCMINSTYTCSGEPDLASIRKHYMKNVINVRKDGVLSYRKFKYYYESFMGYAFWKEECNFKIEQHVRFCEETEAILSNSNNNENDGFITEERLTFILGSLSTKPFPPKMSPWEVLIVRNYIPNPNKLHTDYVPTQQDDDHASHAKFLIVCRVHHAICDGYSILKMNMVNWSGAEPAVVPKAPFVQKSTWTKMGLYLGILLFSPYYQFKQFVLDVDRNFWHISRSKLSREWLTICSEKVSTKGMKEVGRTQGVSTTGVLLAGIGGAIRRYLIETGQSNEIPRVMRSLAPMPWLGHPMDGLVNHW